MRKPYRLGLYVFRRDLRLADNIGLYNALKKCEEVIPCFVLDPVQLSPHNVYRSLRAIEFMRQSLHDLAIQLREHHGRLYVFQGAPAKVIKDIHEQCAIDAIFFNRDYTPYARQRDEQIRSWSVAHGVHYLTYHDLMLSDPDAVLTVQQKPYVRYTAYLHAVANHAAIGVSHRMTDHWYTQPIVGSIDIDRGIQPNPAIIEQYPGGRTHALKLLHRMDRFFDYYDTRDIPSVPTTHLSAHLKFGTISPRELYQKVESALGKNHELIRQLYWRDFFTYIAYHFPWVFGSEFNEKYRRINWSYDVQDFKRWCDGTTGFPLVDAGMRELNQTGFMHNRVRMVVASFLTKDLGIDWRLGEQYFALQLVDYDPAINNGNWQWIASTGCDAQPYFRIFNPWLQQKKYDPACAYIKTWIPELKSVSPQDIHRWYASSISIGYPKPMLDHAVAARKAKAMYRR
jgi:deoxyribodipyrimidine photo-lyase